MGDCIRCGQESGAGTLCSDHARQLATATDVTAEQIVSPCVDGPPAWLVDQWGATHSLAATTLVGRSSEPEVLSVLHPSVSVMHAQIECGPEALSRIVDRGSRNGSYVNGERVRSATISDGDVLRFGDVSFLFTTARLDPTSLAGAGRTAPSRADDILFSATVTTGDGPVSLVQSSSGGIVRIGETELVLGRLEFGLLLALAERRLAFAEPSQCFLSSADLTECLAFNSALADGENVRELVRRVRRKLKSAGVHDLVESRQGAGYRLGWPIRR